MRERYRERELCCIYCSAYHIVFFSASILLRFFSLSNDSNILFYFLFIFISVHWYFVFSILQILEVAVLGIQNEILGEKIIAIIKFRDLATNVCTFHSEIPGTENKNILPKMEINNKFQCLKLLRSFLSDKIAFYKQPQDIFIVDNIPRNHLGKVRNEIFMTFMFYSIFYRSILLIYFSDISS